MKKIIYLFGLMLFAITNFAQLPCAAPSPTPQEYQYTKDYISQIALQRYSGTTCVPIRLHIVRHDDGTGGVSLQSVNEGLAELNEYYLPAGIEFYLCGETPDYLNSDTYYEFTQDEEDAMANAANEVTNALNLYFVNTITIPGFGNASGYAYFPSNSIVSSRMIIDFTYANSSNTMVHEMGHWFNLYHTFEGTSNGPNHPNAENVARPPSGNANCSDHGDLICDTHADPGVTSTNFDFNTCTYIGSETDANGELYTPDIDNVMSYFPDFCQNPYIITPEQYTRIEQGLIIRQGLSAISIDCPASAVNDPSNLTASVVTGGIQLNWQDNSNNEMGFLIERSSTSANAGFSAYSHFGTGPDQTTLFDNHNLEPNTTYWYRVKASNDNCNDYSNVISITSDFYCTVSSDNCSIYVSNVQVGSINNSTNCDGGGYSDYTTISTDMNVGQSYAVAVHQDLAFGGDECGIWIDWNHNGIFTNANETITVSGGPFNYSATVTPPADALSGDTRMRVRVNFNSILAPCGEQQYGETEDYTIHVIGGGNPGTIQFSNLPEGVYEGGSHVFNVTREGGSDGPASVTVTSQNGSAIAGQDFDAVNMQLDWADGESGIKTVWIPIAEDGIDEGIEDFSLTLSNAINATLGTPISGNINIQDYTQLFLNVKLEGPYDSETGLMSDNLRSSNKIPLSEPYTELGFDAIWPSGSESFLPAILDITGNDAIVDWIFVEIHSVTDDTVFETFSALIQRDGDIVDTDGVSPLRFQSVIDFYIVVRHRNHFGVRTLSSFPGTFPTIVDFSDPTTPIFGVNAMNNIGGVRVLISGNANGDSQVNSVDKNSHWRLQNGEPFDYINSRADFNMDGAVNSVDKNSYWRINNSKVEQLE